MNFLRLLAAGLFVYLGLMGTTALLSPWFEEGPPWWMIFLLILLMVALVIAAIALFGSRLKSDISTEETVRELEAKGLLIEETFEARRAFQIEELEDEGSHYMIELVDGRVLYLSGQYLYAYEPMTDDPDFNQPRKFPCKRFTVRRHRDEGYVADILCGREVLEPEIVVPAFSLHAYERGEVPEDGEFMDASYEDLKHRPSPHPSA